MRGLGGLRTAAQQAKSGCSVFTAGRAGMAGFVAPVFCDDEIISMCRNSTCATAPPVSTRCWRFACETSVRPPSSPPAMASLLLLSRRLLVVVIILEPPLCTGSYSSSKTGTACAVPSATVQNIHGLLPAHEHIGHHLSQHASPCPITNVAKGGSRGCGGTLPRDWNLGCRGAEAAARNLRCPGGLVDSWQDS